MCCSWPQLDTPDLFGLLSGPGYTKNLLIEAPTSLVIPEAANREISATVVLKRLLQDLK